MKNNASIHGAGLIFHINKGKLSVVSQSYRAVEPIQVVNLQINLRSM